MSYTEIIKTSIGLLKIRSKNGYICSAKFIDDKIVCTKNDDQLVLDIKNYFKGVSSELVAEYKIFGTEFQCKVWEEITKIPYGATKTYIEIATAIGKPNSYRAVANACGQNRLALFIPCHRIVGKINNGGYKWGTDRKKWLVEFERHNI